MAAKTSAWCEKSLSKSIEQKHPSAFKTLLFHLEGGGGGKGEGAGNEKDWSKVYLCITNPVSSAQKALRLFDYSTLVNSIIQIQTFEKLCRNSIFKRFIRTPGTKDQRNTESFLLYSKFK